VGVRLIERLMGEFGSIKLTRSRKCLGLGVKNDRLNGIFKSKLFREAGAMT
jgi:hypothetical protein